MRFSPRWAVLVAAVAASAAAQPMKFDGAEFVVPDGYGAERRAGQVQLTRLDHSGNTFVQIVIYQSMPASPSPAQDFANEWREVVAKNFKPDVTPTPTPSPSPSASAYLEGASEVSSKIGRSYSHLSVYQLGRRLQSVLVNTSSRALYEELKGTTLSNFFQSLKFSEAVPPAPPHAAPAKKDAGGAP